MKIGINQFCFPDSYDVREAIETAAQLGFDSIEVCLTAGAVSAVPSGGVTDALDISGYRNRLLNVDSTEQDMLELEKIAEDCGIRISSIGGIVSFSVYPLTSEDETIAQKGMDAVKKMLDAARITGADTVLVIPGMLTEDMRYERAYELAQNRICELADYASEINVAIENVWNNMLYSPMELSRFVDETGRRNVGIYFDIANARRFGYPEQWIYSMGTRIKKFHCKDYRMEIDNINAFTNILDGDVNYPAVIRAMREIGYEGDLVVELTPPAHYLVENTVKYAMETLRTLTK